MYLAFDFQVVACRACLGVTELGMCAFQIDLFLIRIIFIYMSLVFLYIARKRTCPSLQGSIV